MPAHAEPTLSRRELSAFRDKYRSDRHELDDLAEFFAVMGNPVRLKTVLLLHERGPVCVYDLKEIFGITAPAMSQHLAKLKAHRIVQSVRHGQTMFYSLCDHPLLSYVLDRRRGG